MTVRNSTERKYYERGMCLNCGKRPPERRRQKCKECAERKNERQRRSYEDKLKEPWQQKMRALRSQRLADGLCVYCGESADVGPRGSIRWCNDCRNRQKAKRQGKGYDRAYNQRERTRAIELYGGKCERCKHEDHRVLTFHHKNNDGGAERKANGKSLGSTVIVRSILKNGKRNDIELLCANCHFLIHWAP